MSIKKTIIRIVPGTAVILTLLSMTFSFHNNRETPGKNPSAGTGNSSDTAAATPEPRDLYADTWVASDALGRLMPAYGEVGPLKKEQRHVTGIFYITWHTQGLAKLEKPYQADVTKILDRDSSARLDATHKLWYTNSYHWGEPEMGYFLSQDEYVIRKDMSMLTDAGIDVLVMDVTNAVRYWDEWAFTFTTMQKMKAEGNIVPRFIFWAFNGPVIGVVQDLYDRIYKEGKYKDLWFYWDGKPLLLYNGNPSVDANHPHSGDPDLTEPFNLAYSREVREFFTLRTMWWGYYEWAGKRFVGTEDNWSFGYSMADPKVKELKPQALLSTHNGKREQAAVTPAQHPVTMTKENMGVGKSWSRQYGEPKLNEYDLPEPAYVPWLGKTVENPEGYGIYFQERWDEVLAADPEFLYINDWNEWTAGKYQPDKGETMPWLGRQNPFFFVDQYNAEFNRGIHPMKGGYTDNYYMQMAQNIRKYKGVRPIPVQHGFSSIRIDGKFADWKAIDNEFRDTRGDTFHRDALGYAGERYVNNSGRNDIITSKVALGGRNISFYVETAGEITSPMGNNWMLLLIDADNNPSTGWYGYDFLINQTILNSKTSTLMRFNPGDLENPWIEFAALDFRYKGTELELQVPRVLLGLTGNDLTFDFKWSDNPEMLNDPISFALHGDTAPNRRFNYRCIWEKK